MSFLKNIYVAVLVSAFVGTMTIANVFGQSDLRSSGRSKLGSFGGNGMITLCHSTGSTENPYETLTVRDNGAAHQNHPADISPAPPEGCPAAGPSGTPAPAPVPEPVTMLLFGAGVTAVGYVARRRKMKA